jgi:hypothetical protein
MISLVEPRACLQECALLSPLLPARKGLKDNALMFHGTKVTEIMIVVLL